MEADVRGAGAELEAIVEGGHSPGAVKGPLRGEGGHSPTDNVSMLNSHENKENSIADKCDDVSKESQNNASAMEVTPGIDSPSHPVGQDTLNSGDFSNGKKRKHRRRNKGGKNHRHRKWKPYDKLTWDERKNLEERETKRACQRRETRFASGQAMAPYNTTQFLMEQHEPGEADLHLDESHREHMHANKAHLPSKEVNSDGPRQSSSDEGSSDEYHDSGEEIFLEKDFTEAYEQFHAERLQGMTKEELVKEYLDLECEVDGLKNQVRKLENENRRNSSGSNTGSLSGRNSTLQSPIVSPMDELKSVNFSSVSKLQEEMQKLQEENCKLSVENSRLRRLKELL